MSGPVGLQLEAAPGILLAAGMVQPGRTSAAKGRPAEGLPEGVVQEPQQMQVRLTMEAAVWSPVRKKECIRHLAQKPNEVYSLLQGTWTEGLEALELLPGIEEMEKASLDVPSGMDKEKVLKQIRDRLIGDPWSALALRGMSKKELLEGVFACWAEKHGSAGEPAGEDAGPSAAGGLAAELARLERKGSAVSSGEWLAEAAAEGSLHQPGPQFSEIESRPFPSRPAIAPETGDWSSLLPHTPRAGEGLALILRQAAEAAALRAAQYRKS